VPVPNDEKGIMLNCKGDIQMKKKRRITGAICSKRKC
jgi:hypothetical protein